MAKDMGTVAVYGDMMAEDMGTASVAGMGTASVAGMEIAIKVGMEDTRVSIKVVPARSIKWGKDN